MVERSAKLATAQCPPLPRDSADRGVPQAEGFGKNQRRSFSKLAENNPCGLCRHPYPRIGARTPLLLRKQRETLLCFSLLTIMLRSRIVHGIACLYRVGTAAQGKTLLRFRQYKLSKLFVLHSTWILSLDKISCISV